MTFREVHGVYDLFLNNYGPNKNVASLHIEVDDTMTADEIDELQRRIEDKIYDETHVLFGP